LIKRGYLYDSSLFPAKGYGYGTNKSICYPYRISSNNFYDESQNEDFFEMPTLVYQLRNWRIPIKLRHFGLVIQKRAIKKMNDCGHPAVITLHTWEIIKIPEKFKNLGTFSKNFIRNYRIPAFSQIEDILKNYEFESISKYLSGRVDKK